MLRRARSFLELKNAELALKVYYKHECRQEKIAYSWGQPGVGSIDHI